MPIDAVIFDLDGVLIDSESIWSEVRHSYVLEHGGRWSSDAATRMMGMSSPEWADYLHDELGVAGSRDQIVADVVHEMAARYGVSPPLLPGAVDTVHRLAKRWPLGLASSSPSRLIAIVLETSELSSNFAAVASTEDIGVGKPAPDIYLAVARMLGVVPERCAAVEDSTNGLRSARTAGLRVIAVPNRSFPPDPAELARADVKVDRLAELTEAIVDPSAGPAHSGH